MESLLSPAFENIASRDENKTYRGLRQINNLLTQLCLPSIALSGQSLQTARSLEDLGQDLAFLEFFKLQNSFEWNVPTRLVECLERLLGSRNSEHNDLLISTTLFLLQGMLLLHPASRSLFGRDVHMNLLLDLLDPSNSSTVLSSTLSVLLTALLDRPQNTRVFEEVQGIATLTSLYKSPEVNDDVKTKVVELFNFYLTSETPTAKANPSPAKDTPQKDGSSKSTSSNGSKVSTRSKEEKQKLLLKYLHNIQGLSLGV